MTAPSAICVVVTALLAISLLPIRLMLYAVDGVGPSITTLAASLVVTATWGRVHPMVLVLIRRQF